MDLVVGPLERVIVKLGRLLKKEYNLKTDVEEKITRLSWDLQSMHAALRKVAEVPPDQLDDEVKLWAHDVRELSYDVEDILDTFLVRVEGRESRNPNKLMHAMEKIWTLFSKIKACRKVDAMIKIINEQARVVAERHHRYKADDIVSKPAETSTVDPRLAVMYKEVTQLVGLEKSCGELISMLSPHGDEESEKKMKMVSVFGVGGLGKTTLAKAVYDKLQIDFDCRAFVPVGQNPDLKKVFRDILLEIDGEKYRKTNFRLWDERQLINELRECLGNNRYLITIDDIWDTKSWQTIKFALVQSNNGSRLITTTRNLEVADEVGEVYRLKPLPYDKSKKLFDTRIFGAEGKCPNNELDEVSDKILKKCDGIPLAIITMASLLVGKSKEEWIEVRNSIAFRDKNNKQVKETEWILSLSYYDLPPHLKTCLLYLSAFPEDTIIDKTSLIWMWVAEGFVQKKQGTGFFEVGEVYFNELVNRSMIMAVESYMGYGCRIHDMVLDLLCVKSQEENFVTISSTNVEGASSQSRVRRLAHHNSSMDQTHHDTKMDLRHVRSFIAFGCPASTLYQGFPFLRFEFLRVLYFKDCCLDNLLHLENLLHLRYLGLCGIVVIHKSFPKGIEGLKYLQTLDFSPCWDKPELPSGIGQLAQLICLRVPGIVRMTVPDGVIGKLTSLEELQLPVLCDNTVGSFVKDVGKLRELRVLKVGFGPYLDNKRIQTFLESLGNLRKIWHLELEGFKNVMDKALWDAVLLLRPLRSLIVRPELEFSCLPLCINPSDLPNLSHLELQVKYMDERDLKTLGGLPELRSLRLFTHSTVTVTLTAADDGLFFRRLRSLTLVGLVPQFVVNKDSSVSWTLWARSDVTTSGSSFSQKIKSSHSEMRDECRVALPTILPDLQVLRFDVYVIELVFSKNGSCLGLACLRSLQKLEVNFCRGRAWADDVEKEEAAVRRAIEAHPNQPTLQLDTFGKPTIRRTAIKVHRNRATLKFSVQPQSEPDDRDDGDDEFASHFLAGIPTFSLGAAPQVATAARLRKSRIHRRPGVSSSLVRGVSRDDASSAASPSLEKRFSLACSLAGDSDAS